jgi:thiol-disulfide isomerase/thioredoxin
MTDSPANSKPPKRPPALLGGWLFGGLVLLAVVWLMRPQPPRFLRVPASGPAPAWEFKDLKGKTVSATQYAGQIVVLNFWATWCPPCVRELPELAAFQRAHVHDLITVIGVSIDGDGGGGAPDVEKFFGRHPSAYPIVTAEREMLDKFGGVSQIPETWVIGRDGRVAARYLGPINQAELERTIASVP